MADMIRVRPVEGRSLPLEKAPRRRVDREMEVPNRVYYRRALSRGDIARAEQPKKPRRASEEK